MSLNTSSIIKLMSAKNVFDKNHPKIKNYIEAVKSKGIRENAVIQLKITNPGEEPMVANIMVKESDLELISQLSDIIK